MLSLAQQAFVFLASLLIIPRKKEQTMSAGALFGLNFLAYAIVFVIVAALAALACFIGIKWRKSKDAKMALESDAAEEKI